MTMAKVRIFIEDTLCKETVRTLEAENEQQILQKLIAYLNQMGIIRYTMVTQP